MLRSLLVPASGTAFILIGLTQAYAGEIRFWVNNLAAFPDRHLAKAESVAHDVYKWIGVEVAFVHCEHFAKADPECFSNPYRDSDLLLNLVPAPARALLARNAEAAAVATCPAGGSAGGEIHIFKPSLDRLMSFDENLASARAALLGYVIAHETAHLLLGCSVEHTPFGLMMAHWERNTLFKIATGVLQFSPRQGEQLRAAVRNRNANRFGR